MATGRPATPGAAPPLFRNRENLDLAIANSDDVADRLAHQRARHRRNVRDRSVARIGLVLADDPERLPPAVVARECDAMAEGEAIARRRRGHELGAAQALGK